MTKYLSGFKDFLLNNYIAINFVIALCLCLLICLTILIKKRKNFLKEFNKINVETETIKSIIPNLIFSIIIVSVFAFAIGYRPYIVTSGSMRPSIEPGAVVLIKKVSLDDLNIGDTITFSYSGTENVTHQIVAKNKNGFTLGEEITYVVDGVEYKTEITSANVGKTIITHGTANRAEVLDAGITIDNVKGKVYYCFWYVGLIVFTIRKQIFAFIILLITLYFGYVNYLKYPKYNFEQ